MEGYAIDKNQFDQELYIDDGRLMIRDDDYHWTPLEPTDPEYAQWLAGALEWGTYIGRLARSCNGKQWTHTS
jgi:hypothetical protein